MLIFGIAGFLQIAGPLRIGKIDANFEVGNGIKSFKRAVRKNGFELRVGI